MKRFHDHDSSVAHLREVADLAVSLATKGVALYEHHWELMAFGGFTITAGRRRECFEFSWDGRDFFLSISHAKDISIDRPSRWQPCESHRLPPDDGKNPIKFIEEFFSKRAEE